MEAVRTPKPGRWWCRAADFGEVQPAHAVLSNGLLASCFIHLALAMSPKLSPVLGMTVSEARPLPFLPLDEFDAEESFSFGGKVTLENRSPPVGLAEF